MNKKTFIRCIELWLPSADASMLEFGGGLFGDARRFEAATRGLCFGRGEGLPGQAWEAGHPVMLNSLQGASFRRSAAAQACGLTSAVALPLFVAEALRAVVVLFCGDDQDHAGAIEIWHNDPEESSDLTLQDGYYGTTGDTFEFLSRNTQFRPGTGLPGRAWAEQTPVFMPDLGRGSGFLRTDSAIKVGINRGLALPCSSTNAQTYVLAFLSALATPIARRVDVWQPDAMVSHLLHSFGFSEDPAPSAPVADQTLALDCDNPVAQVFASGVPVVCNGAVVLPVVAGQRITAVSVLSL